jgi:hypothetical protein
MTRRSKALSPMSSPRIQTDPQPSSKAGGDSKPRFRTKTAATRLTPEELGEIEATAERAGRPLSEWMRGAVLSAARQRSADPAELVLTELCGLRYLLLNLFYGAALAAAEGKQLLPASIIEIRDQSIALKPQQARKLLEDFLASKGKGESL